MYNGPILTNSNHYNKEYNNDIDMCNGPNLTNSNHYIKEHSKATNTIQIIVTTKKQKNMMTNSTTMTYILVKSL